MKSLASTMVVVVMVSGCTEGFVSRKRLGDADAIGTQAELRVVTASPVDYSKKHRRVIPRQVICAEPSPDIAKAFGSSTDVAGALAGSDKANNLDLKTTLALSSSHAEAVAQMTNRLATIQLLRDGLYRACEAYQNGAITDTTYAVMLSRFDKLMVTMLLGELVAGNFGQSLASLTTSAGGSASSSLSTGPAQDTVDKAQQDVNAKQKARDDAAAEVNTLPADASADTRKAKEDALLKADSDLAAANSALTQAQNALKTALAAAASSNAAGAATAAGAITRDLSSAADKRADILGTMQRKYIENINFDPFIVACLTALDRPESESGNSALVQLCTTQLGGLMDAELEDIQARKKIAALRGSKEPSSDSRPTR